MQKRVFGVYFSMMRRSAICAVDVMASASSRMMSLKVASEEVVGFAEKELNICFVLLNVLICSLKTYKQGIDGRCELLGLTEPRRYHDRHWH